MTIAGRNLGKKYGKRWIFKELNVDIPSGAKIGIKGSNGSGKSTLLQILSGYLTPTTGELRFNNKIIDHENLPEIGFAAPSVEIPEEMTLEEFLNFHAEFRQRTLPNKEIAQKSNLPLLHPIKDFSTGMKQRAQLSAIFYFSNTILFMDEPTANLDSEGFEWWKNETLSLSKTVLIASNQEREIEICSSLISL